LRTLENFELEPSSSAGKPANSLNSGTQFIDRQASQLPELRSPVPLPASRSIPWTPELSSSIGKPTDFL